ncbi:MAG: histidine kinase [Allomuricauda sp.]
MKSTISYKFHIGFWLSYTLAYTVLGAGYKNDFQEALIIELLNLPMRLVVCYFNYFLLLPLLIHRNKIVRYVVFTTFSLLVAGFLQRIFNYEVLNILYPDMPDYGLWLPYKFLQSIFVLATPMIFLLGIISIREMAESQKKAKLLENEKLQSELKYLRSQVSPHFLFNTLNHIYGLSLENSKKVSDLILKLSDFLSFSLYESKQPFIPLEKEINLMNDFIALEKSRFDDRVNISLMLPAKKDLKGTIPPLILVPFVENAFKHGLKDTSKKVHIAIRLFIKGDIIDFEVKNTKDDDNASFKTKPNGLGLANIKKRLELVYGEHYTLNIIDSESEYQVNLKIDRK